MLKALKIWKAQLKLFDKGILLIFSTFGEWVIYQKSRRLRVKKKKLGFISMF